MNKKKEEDQKRKILDNQKKSQTKYHQLKVIRLIKKEEDLVNPKETKNQLKRLLMTQFLNRKRLVN